MQKVLVLSVWLLAIPTIFNSCNSVFYQPESEEFVTPERVEVKFDRQNIETKDGVKLHLWHMKPAQTTPPSLRKGIIVQFHGNGENMSTHFLSVVWLTAVGYDVVSFDYRGYGQSGSTKTTRGGCILDGAAVLNWVATQPDLNQLPLFVIGQSLGGAVAVPVISLEKPKHLKGLILDSTFSSYRTITRNKLGSFWLTWPLQWPLSFLVSDEYSPIDYIADLSIPLLFVHAPRDPVVSYDLGKALFDKATSQDKIFWNVNLGGHIAAFAYENSRYRDQLVDWMDKRL